MIFLKDFLYDEPVAFCGKMFLVAFRLVSSGMGGTMILEWPGAVRVRPSDLV